MITSFQYVYWKLYRLKSENSLNLEICVRKKRRRIVILTRLEGLSIRKIYTEME